MPFSSFAWEGGREEECDLCVSEEESLVGGVMQQLKRASEPRSQSFQVGRYQRELGRSSFEAGGEGL